ncbi:hypothetical protein GCM10020256_62410 [Streptomyces thermocoprophilus]
MLAAVRATPQEPAREHTPQLPPHVWGTQPPPRRFRAPRPRPLLAPFATATAAAALVVAALFAVQAGRTQDQLNAERDRAREIAHVLAAPDARATTGTDAEGHSIGVIASVSSGRAVVTLRGYTAPPAGRVRQLWLMRPGAQPRSLGLFDGDTPLARRRPRQVGDVTRSDRRTRRRVTPAHQPAHCPTRPGIGRIRRVIEEGSSTPLQGR